jgi:hypothetical protein
MRKTTEATGCLWSAMRHLMLFGLVCWLLLRFIGPDAILSVAVAYLAVFFEEALVRMFGNVEKRPLVSADEQPPADQ